MEKRISPGLKLTFLIHLIIAGIFGLLCLLIPVQWGNMINWPLTDITMVRLVGAALLGFAFSSWLAYRETAWQSVRIIVQAEIVWTALGALAILWGLLFEALPTFGWVNAIIFTGFAIAFGVFYVREKGKEAIRQPDPLRR